MITGRLSLLLVVTLCHLLLLGIVLSTLCSRLLGTLLRLSNGLLSIVHDPDTVYHSLYTEFFP